MNRDTQKTLVRRLLLDGITKGSDAIFDELLAPSYADHNVIPGLPKPLPNRDVFKQVIAAFHASFPGFTLEPDGEMIAEGRRVAVPFVFRGKNKGEFMGRPATGKDVTMRGIAIYVFGEDSLIHEAFVQEDIHGMLSQLGFVPG